MKAIKIVIGILCLVSVWCIIGPASAAEFEYTLHTGFHFDLWRSDADESGFQFHTPIEVAGRYDAFSLRVLSAVMYTETSPEGRDDVSVSNFADTKINASYEIIGRFPVDILIGLDLNLPTGETRLSADDLLLYLDPDLVSITQLGEGFNINPTLVLGREWERWAAGLGAGYVWRGSYDYSEEVEDYDPGNIFTLSAEVHYLLTSAWQARLFAQYADYGQDTVRDAAFYEEGDFMMIGVGLDYSAGPWETSVSLRSIQRAKSRFDEPSGGILKEEANSHGDEWVADLFCRYALDSRTTLKGLAQFLSIDANDYPRGEDLYVGERQKFALGLAVARQLLANLSGEVGVKGFIVDDDETWYHPTSGRRYRGLSAAVTFTGTF
ncbi:exported hypothetical protein [uncultured Desulfatiglans sp.]|uniref:Uncharacterized protein n=1 Tax=Uncultured Desulfatiglans sp. TaxID=1748965 RepID=A0A653AF77_UNCDX|nr:exported hypothetical protein [uncultured Desulfatiglans sp.]